MKNKINVVLLLILVTFGCATNVKFPVSEIAPAAEGTAKIKQDRNGNYQVEVLIKHLASPDRLTPSGDQYVIWIRTEDGSTVNIGRLQTDRSSTGNLTTSTPFKPIRIFITAENEGEISWPGTMVLFNSGPLDVR